MDKREIRKQKDALHILNKVLVKRKNLIVTALKSGGLDDTERQKAKQIISDLNQAEQFISSAWNTMVDLVWMGERY